MSNSIRVTLPDSSERELPAGTTGAELAAQIGPGLARAAVAIRVAGQIQDLGRPLPDGARVAILTERDADALGVLRHSAAHILATAVREIFPDAGIGFGPAIDSSNVTVPVGRSARISVSSCPPGSTARVGRAIAATGRSGTVRDGVGGRASSWMQWGC